MQDKIKYIIFGLAAFVILIVMMFLGLKVKSLERESQDLQNQNTGLTQQVSEITADNANLQNKIKEVSKTLEETSAQRADVQQQYDQLVQERDAMGQEINKLNKKVEEAEKKGIIPGQQPPAAPSLNDAYLAGILKQKAELEVRVSMMSDTLKGLKAVNDKLTLEKNSLVFEINNLSRESQDIQQASQYNQKMADNLTQELAREKTDKLEIAKRFKALKADNRQLRQQIQSLGERKLSLEKKLNDMQSKNSALESSLASMELYVKQQMFQMDDIKTQMEDARGAAAPRMQQDKRAGSASGRKEAIQLPPIVVRPQQQSGAPSADFGKQARIISIDKDNNFVVVNIGQASDLKTGDTLQVYRDGQNIGTVQVIQTRERIAACDIKDENTPLRVGDLIR